jgi:integrase/recombinase XerD
MRTLANTRSWAQLNRHDDQVLCRAGNGGGHAPLRIDNPELPLGSLQACVSGEEQDHFRVNAAEIMTNSHRRHRPGHALALEDWPEHDRARWQAGSEPQDLISLRNRAHDWSPAGRQLVQNCYGQWLWWLAERDGLDRLCSPGERVTEALVLAYVAEIRKRVRAYSVDGMVRGILRALAVIEPQRDWTWLQTIARNLKAVATSKGALTRKTVPIAELFELGLDLMNEVAARELVTWETARDFRDGLIISLSAARLYRRKNIVALSLLRNLKWVDGRPYIEFASDETKTGNHLYTPWPERLVPYLNTYLQTYRPFLLSLAGPSSLEGQDALWLDQLGRPLSGDLLAHFVAKKTKKRFGFRIGPHHFRRCCATSIAVEDPQHIHVATALLGHSRISMTERHYNMANSLEAGRSLTRSLREIRKDLRSRKRRIGKRDDV